MAYVVGSYRTGIKSMSIYADEVSLIRLEDGEGIYIIAEKRFYQAPPTGAWLVVDRVGEHFASCWAVRMLVEDFDVTWGYVVDKKLRKVCKDRGAEKIYGPGEIIPIYQPGYVAIADFNMSGVNYFLMPAKVYEEFKKAAA